VMYSSRGAKLFSLGIQKRQKRRGMLLWLSLVIPVVPGF
jgi:hypothetical protein